MNAAFTILFFTICWINISGWENEGNDICNLKLVTGPCRAAFKRWGSENGQCKSFTYGGCSGNENNFRSKKKCQEACPSKSIAGKVKCGPLALYDRTAGGCKGKGTKKVYAYNPGEEKCMEFMNCEVASHKFWARKSCKNTCEKENRRCGSSEAADAMVNTCMKKGRGKIFIYNEKTKKCMRLKGCSKGVPTFRTRKRCTQACVKEE